MKYTAFAVELLGVVIVCYAGYEYATGGPPGHAEQPSPVSLLVPLAAGVVLMAVGSAMWAFGGKGYSVSGLKSFRRPAGVPERPVRATRPAADRSVGKGRWPEGR